MDKLKTMTLLEASELVKAIEETFDVDASAGGGGRRRRGGGGGGGEDRVRHRARVVCGGQEDRGAQGGARHHRPGPQGGQGDGRGGAEVDQGGRGQGGGRGRQEADRGGGRRRLAQVDLSPRTGLCVCSRGRWGIRSRTFGQ